MGGSSIHESTFSQFKGYKLSTIAIHEIRLSIHPFSRLNVYTVYTVYPFIRLAV